MDTRLLDLDESHGGACSDKPGRHAAGENPIKRDLILDGAGKVFFEKGFDAASMNDICRTAGVSKGTLYVYFADKVDLFEALVDRERQRLHPELEAALTSDGSTRDKLVAFGRCIAGILSSEQVIQAQRVVISAANKMPDLGARFYNEGAGKAAALLGRFLQKEIAAGRLHVREVDLAVYHFNDLVAGHLWRKRLFATLREVPSAAEIDRNVDAGVDAFLAAYCSAPE